jgi:hypothetical protein
VKTPYEIKQLTEKLQRAKDMYNNLSEILYDVEYKGKAPAKCYKNTNEIRNLIKIVKEEIKKLKKALDE